MAAALFPRQRPNVTDSTTTYGGTVYPFQTGSSVVGPMNSVFIQILDGVAQQSVLLPQGAPSGWNVIDPTPAGNRGFYRLEGSPTYEESVRDLPVIMTSNGSPSKSVRLYTFSTFPYRVTGFT